MIQKFCFWVQTQKLKGETKAYIYTPVFMEVSFTIAKRWKQPEGLLMSDYISEMWYLHQMVYYSILNSDGF